MCKKASKHEKPRDSGCTGAARAGRERAVAQPESWLTWVNGGVKGGVEQMPSAVSTASPVCSPDWLGLEAGLPDIWGLQPCKWAGKCLSTHLEALLNPWAMSSSKAQGQVVLTCWELRLEGEGM